MNNREDSFIIRFLRQESAGGILLVGAALLAVLSANSPLYPFYKLLIDTPLAVIAGHFKIVKPFLLWVNDGLMAVFFLMVGLELKREFLEGELSEKRQIILPGLGALGGMAVPALIYIILNAGNPAALKGWAIPTATDIAFALGVISLLGSRVPTGLRIFLTSLAIFDDIGAILIIAMFYTANISATALIIALLCILILFILNRKGVVEKSPYVIAGIVMWTAMLKSGVHATLAGVILAMFIPISSPKNLDESPLKSMERGLHPAVAFFILPLFAFCNAGISFADTGADMLLHSVSLGTAAGLFIGKQAGVFIFCWLGIMLGLAELPKGMSWTSLYGTAVICGIGFTMSLFIGTLAFEETGVDLVFDERFGIISGSLLSGILGYLILRSSLRRDS